MVKKKFYQKYFLVLFYYQPKSVLRQYTNISNLINFVVFQIVSTQKDLNVIKASFHRSQPIYICYYLTEESKNRIIKI